MRKIFYDVLIDFTDGSLWTGTVGVDETANKDKAISIALSQARTAGKSAPVECIDAEFNPEPHSSLNKI